MKPFADLFRPTTLDEVCGQKKLLHSEQGILRKLMRAPALPNLIFYGPSGTGKTTVAEIIAKATHRRFYRLNATTAGTKDIKEILEQSGTLDHLEGVILYLDEIQYFSKKQQQSLLECIENGSVTLIASTTENPYFYIYNAILSRSIVMEFHPLSKGDIEEVLTRACQKIEETQQVTLSIQKGVLSTFASHAGGDARKAINFLQALYYVSEFRNKTYSLTLASALEICASQGSRYDKDGDEHYDLLSAFQKSIRGSDANAAIFYLAKLLVASDLISPCRRLLVIASEDVGLAYPQALVTVKAAVDAAFQLGLPEARIPLAEATIFLANCPKSNAAISAIDAAMEDVKKGLGSQIPNHLRDAHYDGAKELSRGSTYLNPHNFRFHYVEQTYLPDDIQKKQYYIVQENKLELTFAHYWKRIKK